MCSMLETRPKLQGLPGDIVCCVYEWVMRVLSAASSQADCTAFTLEIGLHPEVRKTFLEYPSLTASLDLGQPDLTPSAIEDCLHFQSCVLTAGWFSFIRTSCSVPEWARSRIPASVHLDLPSVTSDRINETFTGSWASPGVLSLFCYCLMIYGKRSMTLLHLLQKQKAAFFVVHQHHLVLRCSRGH